MMYEILKILHVLSAILLVTSFAYGVQIWRKASDTAELMESLQNVTWAFILPTALFQLMSGFTLISLQHYELNAIWIRGSVIGFIVLMTCWFSFLFYSQIRRIQIFLLSVGFLALLSLVFFMANRI